MTNVGQQQAQRTVTLILSIFKGMGLYPPNHPALLKPLQELHNLLVGFFANQEEFHFGVMDHILFVDRVLFVNPGSSEDELAGILMSKGIEAIGLHRQVSLKEISAFLALMSQGDKSAEMIQLQLTKAGV